MPTSCIRREPCYIEYQLATLNTYAGTVRLDAIHEQISEYTRRYALSLLQTGKRPFLIKIRVGGIYLSTVTSTKWSWSNYLEIVHETNFWVNIQTIRKEIG